MPPLSSHFRLAALILPALGLTSHTDSFLLGTTAPDAFDPDSEESFSQYHFKGKDRRISLENFRKETDFVLKPANRSLGSFCCGYYSHLWLDVFYRDHADLLPFKRPSGIPDADLRHLLRRETEILNAPFVLSVVDLSIPRPEDVPLPVGLEFVERERCIQLFREVLKQSQTWSQLVSTFELLDAAEYTAFFGEVAKLFIDEIQTVC